MPPTSTGDAFVFVLVCRLLPDVNYRIMDVSKKNVDRDHYIVFNQRLFMLCYVMHG